MSSAQQTAVWKHIGFHGLAVGSLSLANDGMVWQSASDASVHRKLAADQLRTASWTAFGKTGLVRIRHVSSSKNNAENEGSSSNTSEWRLDGFPLADFEALQSNIQDRYNVALTVRTACSAGVQYGVTHIKHKMLVLQHCALEQAVEEGQEFEVVTGQEILSLDLQEVSQCVLPGNNRNELELQFPETDTMEAGTDQLVALRMYIPPDQDADPADKEASTAAELLQQTIMSTAKIRKTTGDVLVQFDPSKGAFLTPRGRYGIELYSDFLRMRGQKYDYKIRYSDINRLFLLPKPDEVHMAFVIALDKPIRQGQQRYQYLVMQVSKDPDEVQVNMEEAQLEKEYNGELQPVMRGSLSNLIAKTFKVIAGKKVFIPGKFANASQQACLNCSVRASEGLLYPLEKQFVFIHKPPILVRFSEIDSVEFQRYAGGQGSTRNFDLQVNLKASAVLGGVKDYTFSGIDRSDYAGLYSFLNGKKIAVKNLQEGFLETESSRPSAPVYNEDEIFGVGDGGGGDDGDEESDDESYGKADADKDDEPGSEDSEEGMDDDEMGSEIDDDLDSDLEEARGSGKKSKKSSESSSATPKKSKKSKKKKKADSDSDDDDDSEDETPAKKKRKKKDPNAPKGALSAYFFFMQKNRARIKEENPDAAFTEIGKLSGLEWKKMGVEEKKKYEAMAAKDKLRYADEMKDYTPPDDDSVGKSAKKKGKAAKKKKDPNAPKNALTAFFWFSTEMRPKIKEKHPDLSFGDLGKKIGELYRGLSVDEKKKYDDMAAKDKERYKQEKAKYERGKQATDDGVDDDDEDDDDDSDSD